MVVSIKRCHKLSSGTRHISYVLCCIVAASWLFSLCEKTAHSASKAFRVSCSDKRRHPKILYYSILPTQRHTFTYKQGRFSHHKPQPFMGGGGGGQAGRWNTETEISVLSMVNSDTSYTRRSAGITEVIDSSLHLLRF